ncbi:relaxase [Lichenihabitans sp. Uapishka_5]|uniref:relaxase/mobilization nuclease domain-containing protein n=1 Tax=Lichenihabitans sp. Uapishka_5 TaxID=3037302 RepID=UPI0029E811B8|nr:relaxase [Lichenihabitans sp. Uapishka_5]MDX7953726.1 relaxase [Lichenihabitans sp. Uapishka_5]
MILKGNQRSGGRSLAAHLANVRDNDHVTVHELRSFVSGDLLGAFLEIEAAAIGTRCRQPFFSVSLNPPADALVHFDQYEMAAGAIEAKFPGLSAQPRAIVFHEKEGRRHAHCVWSRIDAERGRALPLSHSRLKLRDVSRMLYAELGLEPPAGIRDERQADPLNYDRPTWQQAKRLGEDPRDLKQIIRQAWEVSDNLASFEAALERQALTLARGDRRGFVVVHHSGEALSLTRYSGLKKADIQARLGKPETLPTIDQVHDVLAVRMTAAVEHRLADLKVVQARQRQPLAARLAALRQAHRAGRLALLAYQVARRAQEDAHRAVRLRTGLMGLWDRVSGKRGRLSEQNGQEEAASRLRDRDEDQALVDTQMVDRRTLQQDVLALRARHADERRYARAELAVMLAMMKDSARAQMQDHAAELDKVKGRGRDSAKPSGQAGPAPPRAV